ncbi:FkbM family methyltransferase [Amycolatopsis sp. NPDC051128]|uniref:FkbM family methyltransferase n=1 Tax=Amycolatopsis sp. NPDC051128 TaxID=3155412 RepID=UPI00341CAF77
MPTLDGLRAAAGLTRLDFVKIDVEGGELHVLQGGQQTIETFRPTMLIEIEARHTARYEYSPDDVVDWLTRRGYTMHAWRNTSEAAN